jgi:hypothetical protein
MERCGAPWGVEDLKRYFFGPVEMLAIVNPTPIVLETMERCGAAGGRGPKAIFFRPVEILAIVNPPP